MRYLIHLLRTVFVSFEALIAVLLLFFWQIYPRPFAWTDEGLIEVALFGLIAPIGGILPIALGLCWKILFPTKKVKALLKWPRYPELRLTTVTGLIFVVLGMVAAFIGAIGRGAMTDGLSSLLIISGYIVSGIAFFSMVVAALTIRAIMAGGR